MQEVVEAVEWLERTLDPAHPFKAEDDNVAHFETTIRVLAGLLAAFHLLDGKQSILALAIDVGLRLLAAFDTEEGLPRNVVSMGGLEASDAGWTTQVSLSEATTLSLEFGYLARVRKPMFTCRPAEPEQADVASHQKGGYRF